MSQRNKECVLQLRSRPEFYTPTSWTVLTHIYRRGAKTPQRDSPRAPPAWHQLLVLKTSKIEV